MKRILFVFLVLLNNGVAFAQNTADKSWHAEAGPMITVPIKYLHYYSVLGLGADVAANRNIIDRLYGGARVNFAYFFGQGSVEGESVSFGLLNTMADVYYLFDQQVLIGFSGGLGLAFGGGGTDANFSRVFYAGYVLNTEKHDYVLTAFFDQTNYQKNIGVRACISLPLPFGNTGK